MLGSNSKTLTDQQLVIQSQQGDATAFRHLYQSYQSKVRSTLYQLCGNQNLDDLVQEVFLRVWKGLPRLRQTNYFSTWLYRITWNVANDERRQFAKQAMTQGGDLAELETRLSRHQDSPSLMEMHYQDLVRRGLQSLSFEHRTVLVLHDLEDLPQKEVAEILKLPTGTVKSRLFYARQAIRTFLHEQGVDDAS
ncbi:MAG: sigma-70 family RNA polymerase sigma factor [Woronichinia naegeliana WA131]|uniref:Sigma-70 family RNA polymerase sigma factor n=1 Tax=Woronichinia naegeliana WA131 TaxID=2824559 RepID=A0A977L1U6_9CYAN|nr:MAG: sigma-70 family RNA polymerase sigma factor [Woronichinia naegeliana WA131]